MSPPSTERLSHTEVEEEDIEYIDDGVELTYDEKLLIEDLDNLNKYSTNSNFDGQTQFRRFGYDSETDECCFSESDEAVIEDSFQQEHEEDEQELESCDAMRERDDGHLKVAAVDVVTADSMQAPMGAPCTYAPHEDSFPFPATNKAWVWAPSEAEGTSTVQTMTDFTNASKKAVRLQWPDANAITGMCAYHTYLAWSASKNKKHYMDHRKNSGQMGIEFEAIP
jgi:hypothetical protein